MLHMNMYAYLVLAALLLVTLVVIYLRHKKPSSKESYENTKSTMYFFKADWCGHCQKFTPTWDKLIEKCNKDGLYPDVEFEVLNVDKPESQELIRSHGVKGFPHISIDKHDGQAPVAYSGNRELSDLFSFLEKNS
jgi:thiol-disulfide isomerase/thioredoxin